MTEESAARRDGPANGPSALVARKEPDSAEAIARTVLDGFVTFRNVFHDLTRGARSRFERGAWQEAQRASMERIESYARAVGEVAAALTDPGPPTIWTWRASKERYAAMIRSLKDRELAETFFNSVYCRLWQHADIRDENAFVHGTVPHETAVRDEPAPTRPYRLADHEGWAELLSGILDDHAFSTPWEDRDRDVASAREAILAEVPADERDVVVELVPTAFYRNKGAYLVGHLVVGGGAAQRRLPLAIAILRDDAGGAIYIDNVIVDEDELSMVFSFTRTYFMVDIDCPRQLVAYLNDLLPGKKRFELYNAIGFYRHGKTEFYRDLLAHLDASDDLFVTAPGIRGMVMAVFTLPSYQTAFKIIKDRFPPQKDVTRDQVMASYTLVKMHDRVGRMADTQEFSNLRLPRARFDEALLAELLEVAAGSVCIEGDEVLVRHCYTERLMTPLNLYIEKADEDAVREALEEYGNAIRQLAAANIFPGDMLLKNFGVTRHGRVVFYDYDEICYLTDVNFRHIPEPQTPEQEMAAEPWYSVGPNDVFPEEFPRFMFANPRIKRLFTQLHGEIFDADYWQGLQQALRHGQVMDVFPYRRRRRFANRFAARWGKDGTGAGEAST